MDGGNKKTKNFGDDQFTKMLNLKMHRLSTFRGIGESSFTKKRAGGSTGGSHANTGAAAGFSSVGGGDTGSEVKGLAE